jgi:hypothetical protein
MGQTSKCRQETIEDYGQMTLSRFLLVLTCLIVRISSAQQECVVPSSQRAKLETICDQVKPVSERIPFNLDDGTSCWFQCPGSMSNATLNSDSINAVKVARLRANLANFSSRLRPRTAQPQGRILSGRNCFPETHSGYQPVSDTFYLKGTSKRVDIILREIAARDTTLANEIRCWFLFEVVLADPDDEHCKPFPFITDERSGTPFISIPKRFIDHPLVGEELFIFMILHEIGHALSEGSCESDAEQWAISVGMPAQYGSSTSATLRRVAEQLRAYNDAVFTADSNDGSSNDPICRGQGGCLNCYPKIDCRCRDIASGLVRWNADRGPADCWETIGEPSPVHACGSTCDPCPNNCPLIPVLCQLSQTLSTDLERLDKEIRAKLCQNEGTPCLLDAARITAELKKLDRPLLRRFARTQRELERIQMRATK